MNACMHARHLRPLLSSVLRYSLAHPTRSCAARRCCLLYAPSHPVPSCSLNQLRAYHELPQG